MQLNKQILLSFFIRWLFYEVIFFAGLAIANWGFNLFSLDHTLSRDYFSLQILLITLSLALISWFAVNLRGQISITLDLSICLFIAFLLAQAVGFQTAFSMSIIAATTFLYECHPFYLRRWAGFFAIKYALDATAIFLLGLFLLWKHSGIFSFMYFFVFYFILVFIRRIILHR